MEVLNKKIKISSPIGLQIGNIVYDNNCDFHRIRANDFSRFNHPNMGGGYGLYAIELSPEILEKCGFKKWGTDDMPRTLSYELGEMHIFPANSFCDFEGYGYLHYKKSKFENGKDESARFKFKYFHQLQNLYFSLTGKELIVNL